MTKGIIIIEQWSPPKVPQYHKRKTDEDIRKLEEAIHRHHVLERKRDIRLQRYDNEFTQVIPEIPAFYHEEKRYTVGEILLGSLKAFLP